MYNNTIILGSKTRLFLAVWVRLAIADIGINHGCSNRSLYMIACMVHTHKTADLLIIENIGV